MPEFTGKLPLFIADTEQGLDGILQMSPGEPTALLGEELSDDAVLRTVNSEMGMAPPDHTLLVVGTVMELTERQNQRSVAINFMKLLPPHPYMISGGRRSVTQSHLGSFQLRHPATGTSLVTPMPMSGAWMVQSALRIDRDEEQLPPPQERLLLDHVFVLNTLVAAITRRHQVGISDAEQEEGLVIPRYLELTARNSEPAPEPQAEAAKIQVQLPELMPARAEDPFKDFAGIDYIVDSLRDIVKLAKVDLAARQEVGLEIEQVIMLSGPSGTGKTQMARMLAVALDAELREMKLQDVAGGTVSEWATKLGTLFERAQNSEKPVLLFFDEADGLLKSGNSGVDANILSVLKKELEDVRKHPNLFVVLATNDEGSLPEEVRSQKRIHRTIRIPRPDSQEQQAIFRHFLVQRPLAKVEVTASTDFEKDGSIDLGLEFLTAEHGYNFAELIGEAEGFTAGDIKSVFDNINRRRVLDSDGDLASLKSPYTQQEVIAALRETRRTREA